MGYYRNKHFILDYIDKTQMCKECCQELTENIEAFEKSIKCFESVGYVDISLVHMLSDSLKKIANKYNIKINKDSHNEENQKW